MLTIFLTVFAALVLAVNIGRAITGTEEIPPAATSFPTAQPTPTPTPKVSVYKDDKCMISSFYPANFMRTDNDLGGSVLQNPQNPEEKISIACQKNIPKPTLTDDGIEIFKSGSISGNLYHDVSDDTGKQLDKLIFKHPVKPFDVFISGYVEINNRFLINLIII